MQVRRKFMIKENRHVIAVTGRGGAGKTTVTSIMIKLLAKEGNKTLLAVDADPPTGLTYALGANPERTVGDIRKRMIEDPGERRRIRDRSTKEILLEETVMKTKTADLLVMGRAEGQGCFCTINEILKYGIESLSKEYDMTLIDCEAGIEQVNRRVISSVNTLVMISDPSVRGIQTAVQLQEIVNSYEVNQPDRVILLVNKVNDRSREALQEAAAKYGVEIAGFIPLDENVESFNLVDTPIIDLPEDSPAVAAVRTVLQKIGLL